MIAGGPDDFRQEAGRLGLSVSRETAGRLEVLAKALRRWQPAINLVGNASLGELWSRHILDSAQIVPHFPGSARSVVDLGTGGGFPGLVVTALRPDLAVTLIELDARKAAFLTEAIRLMGLGASARLVLGRIEAAPPAAADIVTARAVAPLARLLAWADRHRSNTAICLFHRGKGWRTELTEAMKDWDIACDPLSSVTDRDAVILRLGSWAASGLRHRQPKGRRRQDDHRH